MASSGPVYTSLANQRTHIPPTAATSTTPILHAPLPPPPSTLPSGPGPAPVGLGLTLTPGGPSSALPPPTPTIRRHHDGHTQPQPMSTASQRLSEAFEMIRQEFNALMAERDSVRTQAEEFESHLSVQLEELAAMRRSVLDLETQHGQVRSRYEDEIRRLRIEMDDVRAGAGVSSNLTHNFSARGPPPPPAATTSGAAVVADQFLLSAPSSSNWNTNSRQSQSQIHQILPFHNHRLASGAFGRDEQQRERVTGTGTSGRRLPSPISVPERDTDRTSITAGAWETSTKLLAQPQPQSQSQTRSKTSTRERETEGRDRDKDKEREREQLLDLRETKRLKMERVGDRDKEKQRDGREYPVHAASSSLSAPLPSKFGPLYTAHPVSLTAIPTTAPYPSRDREREKDYTLPPLSLSAPGAPGTYSNAYQPSSSHQTLSTFPDGNGNNAYSSNAAGSSGGGNRNGSRNSNKVRPSSAGGSEGGGSDWHVVYNNRVKPVLNINLVHTFVHSSVVCCVQFSQDGKYLATGCNRTVQIYDAFSGSVVCILEDRSADDTGDLYIRSVRFSPDGTMLATGAEDRRIRVWDIAEERIRHVLDGHTQEIYSLDWSQDGRLIVSGSGDRTARIWDMADYETDRSDTLGPSSRVSMTKTLMVPGSSPTLTPSPPAPLVGSGSGGGRTSSSPSPTSGVHPGASTLDTSSNSSTSHTVTSHQLTPNTSATSIPGALLATGHSSDCGITSVAISPDAKFVAAGSLDATVRIWDAETGQLVERLRGHRDSVYSVAFTRDGRGLVSGSLDTTLKGWDIAAAVTGATTVVVNTVGTTGKGKGNGKRKGNSVKEEERDTTTTTKVGTGMCPCTIDFVGHKDYVLSVAMSSDAHWVVSGSKDRHVQFWDAKTGDLQFMLRGHKNSVISLDLNSTHGLLATGSGDNLARVWRYTSV